MYKTLRFGPRRGAEVQSTFVCQTNCVDFIFKPEPAGQFCPKMKRLTHSFCRFYSSVTVRRSFWTEKECLTSILLSMFDPASATEHFGGFSWNTRICHARMTFVKIGAVKVTNYSRVSINLCSHFLHFSSSLDKISLRKTSTKVHWVVVSFKKIAIVESHNFVWGVNELVTVLTTFIDIFS